MISIIIPAYNEANVIQRCINGILSDWDNFDIEIIVVCNGCTDDTAEKARSMGRFVQVIETPVGNKIHALNLGDKKAKGFPRFYIDADIIITGKTVQKLSLAIESNTVLATAPLPYFETGDSSWFVKSYYKIHTQLPASKEGIGGSGVYCISREGRKRFNEFPGVVADDCFVRLQFKTDERLTLPECRSTVYAPRTLSELISIKTRSTFGTLELKTKYPHLWHNIGQNNSTELLRIMLKPKLWPALSSYIFVKILTRIKAKQKAKNEQFIWERDDSSRL